jgi:alcohol dehydrogenase
MVFMKAWRLDDTLEFHDIDRPALRPQSVLVRVEATALVSYFRAYVEDRLPGYFPPARPFTPGTTGIGVIEAVGDNVYDLRPGQRVLLSGYARAAENVPEPTEALLSLTADPGAHALVDDWRDGTLAEYALVPASTVTPIPARLATADGARLAVVLRCLVPYGGFLRGRLSPGETVIVNGATGSFGRAGVQVALAMGAGQVIAAGRSKEILDRLAGTPRVRTVALTGDHDTDVAALGPADLALDIVGQATSPDSTLAALDALHRGGRLVLMGSMTVPLPIDYLALMLSNKEIVGTFMYPADAPARLLNLAAAGLLDLGAIDTAAYPLGELGPAMDRAAEPGAPLVVVSAGAGPATS